MAGILSTDQVTQFRRDGFLFPLPVFDATEAAEWRAELEAFEDRWRLDASLLRPFADYTRANLNVVCPVAARLAQHPTILDQVESIIGPDILCWMAELIVKEPQTNKILTMHQDLTYWGLNHPDDLVTVWVALSDVRVANGAMRFVRGSHLAGQVDHRDTFGDNNLLSRGQEITVDYDETDEVAVELNPGEASLHHGLMFHGSGPNTTDQRRVAMVLRYVSPRVEQAVAPRDYGQLVRGANRSRNLISVAAPSRAFDPGAVALFEEITEAQSTALGEDAEEELSYIRTSSSI